MKGPGLRANLDVRRIWRCPRCGRIARTPGAVTAVRCGCAEETWMQLQPPVKREPFRPPPRTPEQIAEDRADEMDEDEPVAEEQTATETTKPDSEAPAAPEAVMPAAPTSEAAPSSPEPPVKTPQNPSVAEPGSEPDSFGEGIPSVE